MHNIKFAILLFFLLSSIMDYSQKINNGYYNSDKSNLFIYFYNDTIILPYIGGTRSVKIYKGVIDEKKWINFIPVQNKMESSYSIVEKNKNDSKSILRFNLYSYFSGEMYSDWYDGGCNDTRLRCQLKYTTPQNILIKKDTALVFNGKYFEFGLSSDLFINAELIINGGGKYVTIPILKDSLLFVDIVKSPSVHYYDNEKRMRYKYSEKDQSIEILFNIPSCRDCKQWIKYVKTEKPHNNKSFYQLIEKHINDMKKE